MKICLICIGNLTKNVSTSAGVRQRLAITLAALGHQIFLLKFGQEDEVRTEAGVQIHSIPLPRTSNQFSAHLPELDLPLTYSQAIYEALFQLAQVTSFDIVDIPLDQAAGLVTLTHYSEPVVLSLLAGEQSSATGALFNLEQACLKQASAILSDSSARLAAYGLPETDQLIHFVSPEPILSSTPPIIGEQLAEEIVRFYEQVHQHYQVKPRHAKRVYQVADAVDYGVAVSNITRRNAGLLAEVGGEARILSIYAAAPVAHETIRFHPGLVRADDGLIFHFWGYTELEDFLQSYRGPKAIHYHNITPPHYFPPQSRSFEMTRRGYEQLQRMADWFDLITGDSNYNLAEYARFLTRPKPTLWIPPVVEAEEVLAAPFDEPLYQQLRAAAPVNFLFIGRIARNKRQDQVMRVFDYYYREINRYSRLYLVGSFEPNSPYFQELQKLREQLASKEQIIFSGKVSDEAVQAYYRATDIFLSASEHEGFGVPLLEAMAHDVPVVALATTAVPETMGEAGILIHKWDIPRVAELINLLLKDKQWHTKLLVGQRQNLLRFSVTETRQRLAAAVNFLRCGQESPLIIWRGPGI